MHYSELNRPTIVTVLPAICTRTLQFTHIWVNCNFLVRLARKMSVGLNNCWGVYFVTLCTRLSQNQEHDQWHHYQIFDIDIDYFRVLFQVVVEYKFEHVNVQVEEMEQKMSLIGPREIKEVLLHFSMLSHLPQQQE